MELSSQLFSDSWWWGMLVALAPLYWYAVRWADFGRLAREGVSGAYFGSIVVLMLMWTLRTDVHAGIVWHLSGMVFITLAWGWSLALLAGLVAQLALVVAGLNELASVVPTLWVLVILPAVLTQLVLGLVRAYLPKHFFVYVFVDAFFCGALVAAMGVLATVALLVLAGQAWPPLRDDVMILIPLMLFPEAFFNGIIITVLVTLRPQWVWSFRDEEYLSR